MTLSLSTDDQRKLARALRSLLSPLEHATLDSWRHDVTVTLRDLLDADHSTFQMDVPWEALLYSPDIDTETVSKYPGWLEKVDADGDIEQKQRRLGVWSRKMLWYPRTKALYRTAYYNEFVVPLRAFDAVGVCVVPERSSATGAPAHPPANLYCHHAQRTGRRFGRRGLQLLHLLKPALEAGANTFYAFHRRRAEFIRVIDSLQEGVLLFSEAGHLVHPNRAAVDLLEQEPEDEAAVLSAGISEAARSLCHSAAASRKSDEQPSPPAARKVSTRRHRYRVTACCLDPTNFGDHAPIMVSVVRLTGELPSVDTLRRRYALTSQEARVALLLAKRLSNAEIAEVLSVSLHTARHHTEQAFVKLGLHRRGDVHAALTRAGPGAEPS